ncbi:FAD-binding protein [bacterium]|nr:FAD-binding protein [bacterium]
MAFEIIDADVLVIGRGLAGTVAALTAADHGLRVVVLSRGESATSYAQGGIVYRGKGDPDALRDDICEAGCYINYKPAVEKLLERGPGLVDKWLRERFEVPFNKGEDGQNLDLALEGAHQSRRIIHVKDHTGRNIVERQERELKAHSKIELLEGSLIDLIVSNKHSVEPQKVYETLQVNGAYVLLSDMRVVAINSKATILASGGFSALYQYSTGPKTSIGAGIAAAHRAGARTLHMEYTQFHPTVLLVNSEPKALITEAIRGEGAQILNLSGKKFTESLAPRDVVARAMHDEMSEGESPHLFLDIRNVKSIDEKFPGLVARLENENIDYSNGLLPIVPAAHYSIGGVWTDINAATNLKGLWACGEVACSGLHGANRLASTSLLEALVFGETAGAHAAEFVNGQAHPKFKVKAWIEGAEAVDSTLIRQDWSVLKKTMWNYLGLVRSQKRIQRAERLLVDLRNGVESFYKSGQLAHDLVALRHAVLVATLCLYAAKQNRKSLGSHYLRENF